MFAWVPARGERQIHTRKVRSPQTPPPAPPTVSVSVSAAQAALRSVRNIVCRPCDELLTPEEADFPEDFPEAVDRAHPASVAACAPAYVSAPCRVRSVRVPPHHTTSASVAFTARER